MMPIAEDLIMINDDHLRLASGLHIVVAGSKGTGWYPKVRGYDTDGREISVAYYEIEYALKADATRRSREMLQFIKHRAAA